MIETLTVAPAELVPGDALFNDIDNSHWIVTAVTAADAVVIVATAQSPWPFSIASDQQVTIDREVA